MSPESFSRSSLSGLFDSSEDNGESGEAGNPLKKKFKLEYLPVTTPIGHVLLEQLPVV